MILMHRPPGWTPAVMLLVVRRVLGRHGSLPVVRRGRRQDRPVVEALVAAVVVATDHRGRVRVCDGRPSSLAMAAGGVGRTTVVVLAIVVCIRSLGGLHHRLHGARDAYACDHLPSAAEGLAAHLDGGVPDASSLGIELRVVGCGVHCSNEYCEHCGQSWAKDKMIHVPKPDASLERSYYDSPRPRAQPGIGFTNSLR